MSCTAAPPPQSMMSSRYISSFDKYMEDSIKGQICAKRGEGQGHIYHLKADEAILQNWKQFLTHGQNKANLAQYYTEYMMESAPALMNDGPIMCVSGGQDEKTISITREGVREVQSLFSNHEEADTRIILHAVAAAEDGAETLVVESSDKDVLVLLLNH